MGNKLVEKIEQKHFVSAQFSSIYQFLTAQSTKMGVLVSSKSFTVASANDLYRETAKSTFTKLAETIKSVSQTLFSSTDKQITLFTKTNKENIKSISNAITNTKADKTKKPDLQQCYINSISKLTSCVKEIEIDVTKQVKDSKQLSIKTLE